MKDRQNNLLTILIAFVVIRLIDFNNMNVLDYCIVTLSLISIILAIMNYFKHR